MKPLDALFSLSEQCLIATIFVRPEQDFGTIELLNKMGNSRSSGSAILKRWLDAGLLIERRVGNQRRFAANRDFLLYPELRKMALKTVGLAQPLAQALTPLAEKLREAFIFGSVATGKDTSESDVDLLLVGDVDLFVVSPLLDPVEQYLGRPIHVSIYSEDEWLSGSDAILRSIKDGPRIELKEALHAQAG